MGDFNINLLTTGHLANDFLSNFLDRGYIPYFSGVTRSNNSGGTCIDNFYIKSNYCNLKSFTYTKTFTDHFPIFVSFKHFKINNSNNNNIKCNTNNTSINYNCLINLSSDYNWSYLLEFHDPDDFFIALNDSIKTLVNNAKWAKDREYY